MAAPSSTDLLARRMEAKLVAELARARADVARLEVELSEVQGALIESGQPISAAGSLEMKKGAEPEQMGAGSYTGLTMSEAAVQYLKAHNKPIAVGMLCAILENQGFSFASGHPTRALGEALRKRAVRHNDIFTVGNGLWGHKDNFTLTQITRLTKKHGGMGGRSLEDHVSSTKSGVERARASGKRLGAKRKLSAETAAELLRLLANSMSVKKACERVGITSATYYNNRKDLEAWKPGAPWPPPQQTPNKTDDESAERPTLRVVT